MAMRNQPSCIDPLYEKLRSMGFTDDKIANKDTSMPQSKLVASREFKKRRLATAKKEDEDKLKESLADETPGVSIPTDPVAASIATFGDIPVSKLRDKVVSAVGTHLSASNLRSLKGEEGSKEGLLNLLEFATGKSRDFKLRGSLRCYNRLGLWVKEQAVLKGKRSLYVTLPPNWEDEGLLSKVGPGQAEGSLVLKHNYSGREVTIQKHELPVHASFDELFVDFNWSEERVSLRSKSTAEGIKHMNLSAHFAAEFAVTVDGDCEPRTPVKSGGAGSPSSTPSPPAAKDVKEEVADPETLRSHSVKEEVPPNEVYDESQVGLPPAQAATH
jgi:hypothetical protein